MTSRDRRRWDHWLMQRPAFLRLVERVVDQGKARSVAEMLAALADELDAHDEIMEALEQYARFGTEHFAAAGGADRMPPAPVHRVVAAGTRT